MNVQSGIVNNLTHKSLLHAACRLNNVKMVEMLLRHGADANIADGGKRPTFTTMHRAAWNGNLNIIKLLIKYQFNCRKYINSIISTKEPPHNLMSVFLVLCLEGHVKCMEYLYSNFSEWIDTNVKDTWGHNGIYLAVQNQNFEILEYLFTKVYDDKKLLKIMINASLDHDSGRVKVNFILTIFGTQFFQRPDVY